MIDLKYGSLYKNINTLYKIIILYMFTALIWNTSRCDEYLMNYKEN
jgi:hypothetical protein